MNIEQARFNMIEQQIRPWDVLDPGVLELLAIVKREDFVPAVYRALAFVDTEVPLASSTGGQQCMLAPKVEARLLQELAVHKHERVLEIDAELARFAAANLKRAGVMNATVVQADGAVGWPGEAPFDVIVLSGSVAEVPDALLAQLKVGGRLSAIVGFEPVMRAVLITRNGDRGLERRVLFDTVAQRLQGFAEPARFHF